MIHGEILLKRRNMTHGELWLMRKLEMLEKIEKREIKLDLSEVDITSGLPKKLPKDEANRYYNEKLQRYWRERFGEMNQAKNESQTFEEAMRELEKIPEDKKHLKRINLDTFMAALKAAYQMGRAEALQEIEAETITMEDVFEEYIPKLKETL